MRADGVNLVLLLTSRTDIAFTNTEFFIGSTLVGGGVASVCATCAWIAVLVGLLIVAGSRFFCLGWGVSADGLQQLLGVCHQPQLAPEVLHLDLSDFGVSPNIRVFHA